MLSERHRRYKSYFQTLIDELERLGVTGECTDPSPDYNPSYNYNWWRFPSTEIPGIYYGTQFPRENKVFTHLHIHETEVQVNGVNRLELFHALKHRKEEIESDFGSPLKWQCRPSKSPKARSRIVVSRDGNIELPDDELECIRNWHIVNLLKLKAVFLPEIRRALETLT